MIPARTLEEPALMMSQHWCALHKMRLAPHLIHSLWYLLCLRNRLTLQERLQMSGQLLRVAGASLCLAAQSFALQTPRLTRVLIPFPLGHCFLLRARMLLLQQRDEPSSALLYPAVNEHNFLILGQNIKLDLKMDLNVSPYDIDAAFVLE